MHAARRASMVVLALLLPMAVTVPLFAESSPPKQLQQIAKLPLAGQLLDAKAVAPAAKLAQPAAPDQKPATRIAQASGEAVGASFSDLVELGVDYLTADFTDQAQRYLEQAVVLAPTSADAGMVENLHLWAYIHQHRGDAALQAEAAPVVAAETARICSTYVEPETRAFAQLLGQTFEAWRVGDRDAFAELCQQAADTWRGGYLGAWAQLRVGYPYWVDGKWDYERARQAYLKAAADYAGTPVEAEALECLAECTAWFSEQFDPD